MEFKKMSVEQLEARMTEIKSEIEVDGADLDALEEEVRGIKAELESRAQKEAQKVALRKAVANGKGKVIEKMEEPKTMTNEEIRSSKEYIDAFARYLVSENDKECRALLTENVSGTVPVPTIVDDIIRTAWDSNDILSRVKKTFIRGNLRVAFELSADDAYEHTEGTSAPTEESLTFGIVTMVPKNVKKWIRISDEVVAMGEQFVRYVYTELAKKVLDKLTALVIADIVNAPTTADADEAAVANITEAVDVNTVADAFANLCDEAKNVVVIMNKLTYSTFKAAAKAANFAMDIFEGFPVLYNNTLPAYATASDNQAYMIVGDLDGEQVNYPEGEGIIIKFDDISESEKDMNKVVGRQYAAHALTACKRFTVVKKPASATT